MIRLILGTACLGAASGMKCPGSPSWIHASAEVVATARATCETVREEMLARVQSPSWTDPHNAGTYEALPSTENELEFSRLTGDKKYTDKMTISLAPVGQKCMITGCSESQVFSIADFSTNYCNLRNLYCGSADGCKPVKHDFEVIETKVTPSLGAGSDAKSCISSLVKL
mmetsp:Transcript_11523/g.21796  ORF Transcript_11523/g.21796 Transcript_11523/m.21796 type:complete len:170 (+) Transcript_11523:58-567(+)